jgi:P4 family phage/plasmid primase-like protien
MNIHIPTKKELEDEAFLKYARDFYDKKQTLEGDKAAAEWLLQYRNIITEPLTGKMYVYDPKKGYYTKAGEALLKNDLVNVFGIIANKTRISEIMSRTAALSYRDPEELEKTTPSHLIPLENGVYDLNTNQLLPHSPQWFFTYKHPVTFNPGAGCPNITNFLNTIVEKPNEEILIDIAALCLYRGRITRHFFILYGDGHNGKSKYIDLIRNILGKQRCSSITPQNLEKNQFTSSQLHDKHANLGADIPGGVIGDMTIIKTITGGDQVSVEFKGKDRFETLLYCELIYSSNTPPRFIEDTRAVWDRLISIHFPYTFVAKEDMREPSHKEADLELEKKIEDPTELSGFLNVLIARLTTLLKTKRLTVKVTPEETRNHYVTITNGPMIFIQECCEQTQYLPGDNTLQAEGWISRTQLYREYQNWCLLKKIKIESSSIFGRRVKEIPGWGIEEGRESVGGGERILSYRNLSFLSQKMQETAGRPVTEIPYSASYSKLDGNRIEKIGDSSDTQPRKIGSVQEIVSFISQLQDQFVITTALIAEHWGGQPQHLPIALEVLLQRGDIFSPSPDVWRAA